MFLGNDDDDGVAPRSAQGVDGPCDQWTTGDFPELFETLTARSGSFTPPPGGDYRRGLTRTYGRALPENFVEHLLGFSFVAVLSEGELGDEDLTGFGEHPLLTRSQPLLLVALVKAADDVGHLIDVP